VASDCRRRDSKKIGSSVVMNVRRGSKLLQRHPTKAAMLPIAHNRRLSERISQLVSQKYNFSVY
jgi:hypothetical protein